MDKYNHWIGKLFNKLFGNGYDYAVTVGQTTYYSCNKAMVDSKAWWRRHENEHKKQYKKDGVPLFLIHYLWYQLRYGYQKNPYEVAARKAEHR